MTGISDSSNAHHLLLSCMSNCSAASTLAGWWVHLMPSLPLGGGGWDNSLGCHKFIEVPASCVLHRNAEVLGREEALPEADNVRMDQAGVVDDFPLHLRQPVLSLPHGYLMTPSNDPEGLTTSQWSANNASRKMSSP